MAAVALSPVSAFDDPVAPQVHGAVPGVAVASRGVGAGAVAEDYLDAGELAQPRSSGSVITKSGQGTVFNVALQDNLGGESPGDFGGGPEDIDIRADLNNR